jgi:uncharacterized protein
VSESVLATDGVLDVGQFVRNQQLWKRDVPVVQLARLRDCLASDAGSISVELVGRHENKKLWLDFSITGQVSLVCQRCLQPVVFPLQLEGELRVVDTIDVLTAEDQSNEEWSVDDIEDAVIADCPLSLLELVEDEIVLALPMAATHEGCEIVVAGDRGDALSPFAALRVLKVT